MSEIPTSSTRCRVRDIRKDLREDIGMLSQYEDDFIVTMMVKHTKQDPSYVAALEKIGYIRQRWELAMIETLEPSYLVEAKVGDLIEYATNHPWVISIHPPQYVKLADT